MADTCSKHSFELATGVCRECRNSYCAECLVYPKGPKKAPYCVTCALSAAGVRRKGAEPNPRLRKKGLFGRRVLIDEKPRHELGFNDVHIELPDQLYETSAVTNTTRREAPAELVAAVAAAESSTATSSGADFDVMAAAVTSDDTAGGLADWASSLGEPGAGATEPGRGSAPWPEHEPAAWPGSDADSGTSF